MTNDRYSTRIDFDLTRELAKRLDEIIQRGIVGSKPEAIRQALMEYFNKLDEQQLRRARLRLLNLSADKIHWFREAPYRF